jgi:hypothetical protein
MPDLPKPAFRYRTATLLGTWRNTAAAAVADAIRAKQARHDGDGAGWHWIVPGAIEERGGVSVTSPRNDNFPPLRERRRA